MRSYFIQVDDELFEVNSAKEASDLLDEVVLLAGEENVEIEIVKPPRISIKTAAQKPTKSKKLLSKVKEAQDKIAAIYKQRTEAIRKQREMDKEISDRLLNKIAHEDDEAAIMALLL